MVAIATRTSTVAGTSLPGVTLIQPVVYSDQRGQFFEAYHRDRYRSLGIDAELVQDNVSLSRAGTLRGLHFQKEHPQGKLVWVTEGEIFDVVVDIRLDSPTFGQWMGAYLSSSNRRQLWIPPGCAHGFLVTGERAHVTYKVSTFYRPDDERSIRWDDKDLGILWPLTGDPVLSDRDRQAPAFRDVTL